ncbi:MAG: BMP family ABC transporter substrate-binding protein [Chloroflexota bacterium]
MDRSVRARAGRFALAGVLAGSLLAVGAPLTVVAAAEGGCEAVNGTVQLPDVVEGKFNVAMVLIGPHDDAGWSEAHYDGLIHLCENMADSHVAYVELVPEGADAEQVFRSLSRKGFDMIIGTSFGYMDAMAAVAEEFPDITYLHTTGYKSNGRNFGNLMGAMEDFTYLAGMLSGSRAKADGNPKLGYAATFPIPEVVRLGNAFMLGAKVTCPECTMDVRYINTWHDPVKEREGAASLFDAGAQVVFTGADTAANADVAAEKGKWAVTHKHYRSCANDACLTAPYWMWGPEYTRIAELARNGEYVGGADYFDADSGSIGLYGFMDGQEAMPGIADLPAEDVALVRETLAKFLSGEMNRFDVFAGEIRDSTGAVVVPAGEKMDQADLEQFVRIEDGGMCRFCMKFWVEGVNGEIPS